MEKKTYILGSHNSWSYLRPRKWWQRLIAFTAQCQSADIYCQYDIYGVRCFDLRLRTKEDGSYCLAHGLVEYDAATLFLDIDFLNGKSTPEDPVYVRVIHETSRHGKQSTDKERDAFRELCRILQTNYPNVIFYGGFDVRTWHKVYDFCTDQPSEDGCYASNQLPHLYDDWWPWWYAIFHNRKHYTQGTNQDVLVLDFVDIR